MGPLTYLEIKKRLGHEGALLVEEGMRVGLGTGSTAAYFIESLIERYRSGLRFSAFSSSKKSTEQAKQGGIPMIPMDQFVHLDLTVDGADEIDGQGRMIKGGGGALVREKILAFSSKREVILVDESKLVDVLGRFGLPVEIIPFGYRSTISQIKNLGYTGKIRLKGDGSHYMTDNGNMIFDIHAAKGFPHPEKDHALLVMIPGVVETGLFFNLPLEVLVGYQDGSVTRLVYGRNS